MEKKNTFVEPEVEVLEFDPSDVICTSGCEYETPEIGG